MTELISGHGDYSSDKELNTQVAIRRIDWRQTRKTSLGVDLLVLLLEPLAVVIQLWIVFFRASDLGSFPFGTLVVMLVCFGRYFGTLA